MDEKLTKMKKQEQDLLNLLHESFGSSNDDDHGEPVSKPLADTPTTSNNNNDDKAAAAANRDSDSPDDRSSNDDDDDDYEVGENNNNDDGNNEEERVQEDTEIGLGELDTLPGIHEEENSAFNRGFGRVNYDTYFADERIRIPEIDQDRFSLRKLWAFTGPGFLMSIAFLDPGNVESDLQAGTIASYKLLWVLLSATLLGLIMQRLSARLGVVTGLHLAEMCHRQFRTVPRLLLWIMTEIAIIGSDMQEVIGTAIAIYLLTSKAVPIWAGVLITIFDTFTVLFLDKYGLRKLELLFGFFITVMAVTFGFEYVVSAPPTGEIIKGLVIPWCKNCDRSALLQAVGIIGANIQPHNLHLHSALVKSRDINRRESSRVKEANKYFFVEAAIALFVAFLINLFVMAVFAYGLFEKTNSDVYEICASKNFTMGTEIFPNNNASVEADLYNGGIYLGCKFGTIAMIIWAIGLVASGQSSTMTGTYAGQFAMEGFLNLHWPRWKRVLLTRSIAIVPTFIVAFYTSINAMTYFNDILNVLMSLQLPFAALPTIAFTSNACIMGEFRNGIFSNILATFMTLVVIVINIYLVYLTVWDAVKTNLSNFEGLVILGVAIIAIFYVLFCLYLLVYLAIGMGATSLKKYKLISKYIRGPVDRTLGLENTSSEYLSE